MYNENIINNVLGELEYVDTSELNNKQQMMLARCESLLDDLAWELQEEEAVEFMKHINEEEK